MNVRPIIHSLAIALCFAFPLSQAHAGEKKPAARHTEQNARYTIRIVGDTITITRKSDKATGVLHGLLWGRSADSQFLPERMLSPDGSLLIVLMKDFSYLALNLDEYFENKRDVNACPTAMKLVGGGFKPTVYDHSPYFWELDKVISDNLIKGKVAPVLRERDESATFYLCSFNEVVGENALVTEGLTLRTEEGSVEYHCRLLADSERFKELANQEAALDKKAAR